jgi:hypothetical protein
MNNILSFFKIVTARSRAFSDYSTGEVAFVSNGFYNNGVIGFVDPFTDDKVITELAICVSAFCEATVQKPPFVARGNGGSGLTILLPINKIDYDTMLNLASLINIHLKWKYSYGRMVNKMRLEKEIVPMVNLRGNTIAEQVKALIPKSHQSEKLDKNFFAMKIKVTQLFSLEHGDFHSLNDLDHGRYPTVSRIEYNNGIAGYYNKPTEANVYPPLTLTVSTVTGDCFVQLEEYIATDNVVILTPLFPLKRETLFFIAMMINKEKWRWMYGRQCYKNKFATTSVYLPCQETGEINEDLIKNICNTSWGWDFVELFIEKSIQVN